MKSHFRQDQEGLNPGDFRAVGHTGFDLYTAPPTDAHRRILEGRDVPHLERHLEHRGVGVALTPGCQRGFTWTVVLAVVN
jgi:hypothetical protein